MVPPFEVEAVSDSVGDFSIDLLDGEYEVKFDGRGDIEIVVPDDPDLTYNVATLIADQPGIIQVVARTMPTRGINYLFADDGYHYLKNLTTGLWHQYEFYGDPVSAQILEAANPDAATAVAVSGNNYSFQSDRTWRLKNVDSGLFHSLYSDGAYGSESGLIDTSAASLAAGTIAVVRSINMRVVGRLQQFFNAVQGKWATPYVVGPENAESIAWYPAVT